MERVTLRFDPKHEGPALRILVPASFWEELVDSGPDGQCELRDVVMLHIEDMDALEAPIHLEQGGSAQLTITRLVIERNDSEELAPASG